MSYKYFSWTFAISKHLTCMVLHLLAQREQRTLRWPHHVQQLVVVVQARQRWYAAIRSVVQPGRTPRRADRARAELVPVATSAAATLAHQRLPEGGTAGKGKGTTWKCGWLGIGSCKGGLGIACVFFLQLGGTNKSKREREWATNHPKISTLHEVVFTN